MHKKSVIVFVFIFVVQALSAGLAVIPQESSTDTWQGPVLESGARSIGVLTDSQQQSILTNQTYNGSNDNDGDGVVDNLDSDDDNDCIPDSNDTSPLDFDGDGINDVSDIDDDGDGLNDSLEVSDSNASTNIYDADNDGNHDCAFFSSGTSTGGNNTGGNNTGGNQTSPCGSNVNYTSVYAYAPNMVMENQSFMTTMYVNCEIYNSSMMLDYWIYDSSNSTVSSGNQSWTGSSTTSSNYTWNILGLSAGYYVFHADLYVNGTWVDSDADSFMVYANNSGGGGNNSGGNNTGGNNTGGNNTGGNNTGGNNTGGNNTGGNNTGGNNTGG
ncbi:MAG: hypothetical protein P8Q40_01365, partial [Candidatus Poseidonia sp.]|uniref:hypothetical protein n=1 Tax=Poseidonia sp. TaxID=2666344 RepID=UPI0030C024CF|nr:hypothetical protein [Poseidonia sp.]